ncbi:MAG: hypothetical protein U0Q15_15005 [Kineosporiaceae bacterium]
MADETRDGVALTHLDAPLTGDGPETKRHLIDYLEAMADRIVPVLAGRALSVIRVRAGQAPFMQKNLPASAPEWINTVTMWSAGSRRDIRYPTVDDARTLLWLGNQRAVEYHPALFLASAWNEPTHLVVDVDPPEERDPFDAAVATAHLVRQVLDDAGMASVVKTSGSKGVHVMVPLDGVPPVEDVAAATRAVAVRAAALDPSLATTEFVVADRGGRVFVDATRVGGGTVAAAYSPRLRPGVPVSMPVAWEAIDDVRPQDFTIRTVPDLLGTADPWRHLMPAPQTLDAGLVEQGRTIPVARVAAMHAGKRRAKAIRDAANG